MISISISHSCNNNNNNDRLLSFGRHKMNISPLIVCPFHCDHDHYTVIVGAVVFVGMARNGVKNVNWRMFLKICASWALTLPFSALLAAALTAALRGTAKE